ncbi:MAG: shikimate dehydrogenase family protein [Alloprevotella sp.]
MTQTFGLLGHPLGHSFSAAYFAEKFAKLGLDAVYRNFDFAEVPDALDHILSIENLKGFNVTIPHKQAIIPHLASLSPEAREIGAVNVVKAVARPEGDYELHGHNSDWIGFSHSLLKLLPEDFAGITALVFGTGGASRAVAYSLRRLGIPFLFVSRRKQEGGLTYEELTPELLRSRRLLVNCTPLGMHPHVEGCPSLPWDGVGEGHYLYDLVYNPLATRFLLEGEKRGAATLNGLPMLHLQAEAAWQIWNAEQN